MAITAVVLGSDPLAVATISELRGRKVHVVSVSPHEIADLRITLDARRFMVDGRPIDGLWIRDPIGRTYPMGFSPSDWPFVLAEVGASWLAATRMSSVVVINRIDEETWFEDARWPVWHHKILGVVPVTPLRYGDHQGLRYWRPYCGGEERPSPDERTRKTLGTALTDYPIVGRGLFVGGDAVQPDSPCAASSAARWLNSEGVDLCEIAYDSEERVAGVDIFPAVPSELVEPVAGRLATIFNDRLRRR